MRIVSWDLGFEAVKDSYEGPSGWFSIATLDLEHVNIIIMLFKYNLNVIRISLII